ncbi:MAG: glycyl radical protein [Candidatus Humimicrobiia bacterium]
MGSKKNRKPITKRIEKLRNKIINTVRKLDIERARLFTESYKKNENKPLILRRAMSLSYVLENMTIAIDPNELVVGDKAIEPRNGDVSPEMAVDWINEELENLPIRPQDQFKVSSRDISELREEIFPYWEGKTLKEAINNAMKGEIRRAIQEGVFILNQTDHGQGHILPNMEKWLKKGICGLKKDVEEHINKFKSCASKNYRKFNFYKSALITLEASEVFIKRYADLSKEMASNFDGMEKENLYKISEICTNLINRPPITFREAIQALWFLIVIIQIESNVTSISPGRLDQYLFSYYLKDINSGNISKIHAQEILENLWINFNKIVFLRSSESAQYYAGFPMGFNIAIGGQNIDGKDATNELSYMCLKAQEDIGFPQPNLSVRLHSTTPTDFLLEVCKAISYGDGQPQLFNDEVIIPALLNCGYSYEDARNYAIVGCVEISVPGNTMGLTNAAMVNMVKILELTMNNGVSRTTQHQVGTKTGTLSTFEDFEEAFEKQLKHFISLMVRGSRIVEKMHASMVPTPFLSTVIDNCLEKRKDVTDGGAKYNFSGVQGVQIANIADSLIVIKKVIYEDNLLDLKSFNVILDKNYEDAEEIRQMLIYKLPKYGNDIEEVDNLANKWAKKYCKLIEEHKNYRGGQFHPGFYTVSAYIPMGFVVGATPDGRKAFSPLADGGLSPMRGLDVKGPTAILKSVSKIDLLLASNGSLLNLKFLPSFFETDGAFKHFSAFLRTFVDLKVQHVQFNVISSKILREAQKEPQNYRNLLVRVAGYSAFFVELSKEMQEEIIMRTEHTG